MMHSPAQLPTPTQTKPSRLRRAVSGLVMLLILGGIGYAIYHFAYAPKVEQQRRGRFAKLANATVPVLAVKATTADVPVYLDGVGTAKALNTVTVRPQVDGQLVSVNFKEGQDVEKGFVLAEIDPAAYQAQYDQAVAKKAQDEAQLANAKRDLERYEKLVKSAAGSQQQADTQRAQVAQLEAQIRSDQAAIDAAKTTLDRTKITAPISGRTGIRQVDVGNIVHASDASGIVTITQIKPVAVLFSLPQQNLIAVNKAFAAGPLAVDALDADNAKVLEHGKLVVVDNQVDQTTGTVKLKAEFPNADLQLWPGQFVNVRLLIDTLKSVVTVPTAAVQRGPNGAFVFVVQPDSTVAVRNVKVAQQTDVRAVIADGLKPDEEVVTSGFAQLANGTKVKVTSPGSRPEPVAAATPTDPPNGERPKGNWKKGERKKRQRVSPDAPKTTP